MEMLRAATLTVADVKGTVDRYVTWLGYQLVDDGVVSVDLAESWGCPGSAGRALAILRPASGSPVFIRCVEGDPVPDYRPLRTYGWSTIELCVTDVLAVQEHIAKSPFEIIGPAKKNPALPTIFPMQVRGPDQEIVYLTEILGDLAQYDLPRAKSLIDRIFIMVLGCSDMRASRAWFAANLGLSPGRDIATPYETLAQSFGTPPGQIYTICTMTHERDVFLELDQYPAMATARTQIPGALPPGIAMATFRCADFDKIPGRWIAPPKLRGGPIYDGAMAGTLQAPDGTLVEVVAA
jgi:catechol 2,3-dioxygenase-like lactoylglutathione lyase family enzyme